MRLGQDKEAYQDLETCFKNGFQDAATRNSLKLLTATRGSFSPRSAATP